MSGPGVPPVVAGYLAVPAHVDAAGAEELLTVWRASFASFARREGYALGAVFVDVRGRGESGLYGLVDYLLRDDVVAVLVQDLRHLARTRRLSGADRRAAQRHLRSTVLVVDGTDSPVWM